MLAIADPYTPWKYSRLYPPLIGKKTYSEETFISTPGSIKTRNIRFKNQYRIIKKSRNYYLVKGLYTKYGSKEIDTSCAFWVCMEKGQGTVCWMWTRKIEKKECTLKNINCIIIQNISMDIPWNSYRCWKKSQYSWVWIYVKNTCEPLST